MTEIVLHFAFEVDMSLRSVSCATQSRVQQELCLGHSGRNSATSSQFDEISIGEVCSFHGHWQPSVSLRSDIEHNRTRSKV
ncbi:hypothetical protein PMIN05_008941 [Paraphaeosphaeria minitans]